MDISIGGGLRVLIIFNLNISCLQLQSGTKKPIFQYKMYYMVGKSVQVSSKSQKINRIQSAKQWGKCLLNRFLDLESPAFHTFVCKLPMDGFPPVQFS